MPPRRDRLGPPHPKNGKDQRRPSNKERIVREPANASLPNASRLQRGYSASGPSMDSQKKSYGSYLDAFLQKSKDGETNKEDDSKPMTQGEEVSTDASGSLESGSGASSDKKADVGCPDEQKTETEPVEELVLGPPPSSKDLYKSKRCFDCNCPYGICCWNIHEYDDLLTCQLYLRTGQCYYGEKECPFPHSPDGLKTKFTGKGKRLQVFNDVEAGKYTYSLPDSPSTDEPPEGASRE